MASDKSSGQPGRNGPVLRKRATSARKRSLDSPCANRISPEKRLRVNGVVSVDSVEVQAGKCLDYLFKLNQHAAISDLSELELDLFVCKDCLEQLNVVIMQAKKMLTEGERRGSCGSPSHSEMDQGSTQETLSDISSSSGSSASQTNTAASDHRRSKLKSLIHSVFEADLSNGNDYDCRFVGWRK